MTLRQKLDVLLARARAAKGDPPSFAVRFVACLPLWQVVYEVFDVEMALMGGDWRRHFAPIEDEL